MTNIEYSFVMIKPDGIKEDTIVEIMDRIHSVNLQVFKFDVRNLTEEEINEHYSHLMFESYFDVLKDYMMSGCVVPMIVCGENAITKMRTLIGHTNSKEALPGTIRGDFGNKEDIERNVIHSSDSSESAYNEVNRFFGDITKSITPVESCIDTSNILKMIKEF